MTGKRLCGTRRGLTAILLCLALLLGAAFPALAAEANENIPFRYRHDPRLNESAMADIQADPDAIYGFSPNSEGSLKQYADADWTDPAVVENARQERIAYHQSMQEMYQLLSEMQNEGKGIEEIARAISAKRNEVRLAAYADDPEGLATVKARNLEKYGHEDGPHADELYEQYGSWEVVLQKAFSANSGMDACLGLYDDYYGVYVISGQVPVESLQPASREYAVAAFLDALGWETADAALLSAFSDGADVTEYYAPEMAAAVAAGLVKGYPEGTLYPRQGITRLEAFLLLSRCLPAEEPSGTPLEFTDVPDWAKTEVDRLSAAGLVEGYGAGVLGAADPLTVEQVGILVRRLSGEEA